MSGRRIVVALCGCMRAGKDTIAEHLCDSHAFVNLKVSAPLKQGLVHMFGFSQAQVEGALKDVVDAQWNVTPRQVMQWLGTDVFQHRIAAELLPGMGRLFWVTQLMHRIGEGDGHVVISDLRFQHELDAVEGLDAARYHVITVKVERTTCVADSEAPVVVRDSHESELCRLRTNSTLHNDSTIPRLLAQVDELLTRCRAEAATHAGAPCDPGAALVPRPDAPGRGPVCA